MGNHPREGIVIRPPFEVRKNNGERIIAKHKGQAFAERTTPQAVLDPGRLKVLADAEAIANEWVTEQRLSHVLQHIVAEPDPTVSVIGMEQMGDVIKAMIEDVEREAKGEGS